MKRKRIISLLLAAVLLLTAAPCGFAAAPNGDVDFDGAVTPEDARLTLRASVGLENISAAAKAWADVDRDGKITSADARLILRASVGLEKLA